MCSKACSAGKTLAFEGSELAQNGFDQKFLSVLSSSSEKATITFASAILDITRSCVVLSTGRLSFNHLDFSVAGGAFLRNSEFMSSSTSRDRLLLDSKTFAPASSPKVEGALVRAEGCSVQTEGCVSMLLLPLYLSCASEDLWR
ncbi:uncharacterized protein MONOS_397 [Monocercomonoides exilis]|uniref:uncharacterized protein n=1 Tax=Monocercomonoides exilis TaxID=2049356 RepID=UPI003559F029|nr:hypothetical protein MONOS_397 [Monocercomonoides exilis]|eukprot:MONOS_397.1-p1 / transcript=MONOS_397.1 / gene=MONOS_397 / organism=Monocercomonoides_exilis_PA203 / gene_product=unspecified product / transcript_product=unspecified product / location=Mono_scaffold00006:227443-228181(+) / protein_length=144 / sequence_SO=supercontig / SO=protein_coding / is_pseudo=false